MSSKALSSFPIVALGISGLGSPSTSSGLRSFELFTMWYVYILECADKSYYVGITPNLGRRLNEHNTGCGGFWTGMRRPVMLKYFEKLKTRIEAEARELQLKGWSRKKKEALINGNVLSLLRHRQEF